MAATVVIKSRGIGITDKVREYAEKKVGKLDHYLPEIGEVRVDLSAEQTARDANERQVVQLTVPLRGTILRCEERAGDILAGIDMALDKMHRQIERYKSKHRRSRGDGHVLLEDSEIEMLTETEEDSRPQIIRRKKFLITPMTEAEAIEQMALSQHDNFFIFYNADTAKVNVLYLRQDGNFGLIDPEVA